MAQRCSVMWIIFITLLVSLILGSVFILLINICMVWRSVTGWQLKKINKYPKVGLIIPHFNEDPTCLMKSLNAIEDQEYPSAITVIVCDDGSTNEIQVHLQPWLLMKRRQNYISVTLAQNTGSKGKAMDKAIASVPSDVEALVVVDSDTFLEKTSVIRVVERLWQNEKYAAVCGQIIPTQNTNNMIGKLQYYEHIGIYPALKYALDHFGFVTVMAGAFVVHRMSVIRKVGGWGRWIVEDLAWTWLALAYGYRTGYAPDAVAYTNCPTTPLGLFKQRRRWARGRIEAFKAVWEISQVKGLLLIPMLLIWLVGLIPFTFFFIAITRYHLFAMVGLWSDWNNNYFEYLAIFKLSREISA